VPNDLVFGIEQIVELFLKDIFELSIVFHRPSVAALCTVITVARMPRHPPSPNGGVHSHTRAKG
jgi:hypothetical protein